jgi:hypothetical protein
MYDGRMVRWVACLLLVSCAHSSSPPTVKSSASIGTAGDRCPGGVCTCRAVDDYGRGGPSDEKDVAAGQKRFELRTGRGLDEMEVTVEGRGTLKKSKESPEAACAYVDLPPGKHRVHLHARASEMGGMVPALLVNEWSARTHDWYGSFQFRCGGGRTCTKDLLAEWAETDGKRPRGIFDPCGSTRVENLKWDVSHAADVTVEELDLDFVLEVYKFVPRFPHGAKTCKGVGGVEREDEPTDLPQ